MIKNITLENFFSFGQRQPIELNTGVNVLVGINGSGKSNFLRSIELLHAGVSEKGFEESIQKKWNGFSGVKNLSPFAHEVIKISFEFQGELFGVDMQNSFIYGISISQSGNKTYLLSEHLAEFVYDKNEHKSHLFYNFMDKTFEVLLVENFENVELKKYAKNQFNESELIVAQISDPQRFKVLSQLSSAVSEIVLYSNFNTAFNSPIRNLNSYETDTKLRPDGSNLVSLLQKIKNNHTLEFEKIEEAFSQINPHFKSIDFDYLGSKFQLVIREKNLSKTITAEHISDGTLRFLLLLSILYNPERGNLVCLDEPETGLHPDMIRTIAKAIKYAAFNGTQIILATHSPLLLNHFQVDDILIFEKDKNNETVVSTKDEDDFKDWSNQYQTGQLWVNGKLGGVRW